MASAARVQRRTLRNERVGDILSDSNSELSSIDGDEDGVKSRKVVMKEIARPEALSSDGSDPDEVVKMNDNQAITRDTKAAAIQRTKPLHPMKRKNSKWYDSDDDEWAVGHEKTGMKTKTSSSADVVDHKTQPVSEVAHMMSPTNLPDNLLSPTNNASSSNVNSAAAAPMNGGKRSSFARLVDKTFNLSPFASKRKGLDVASPVSSGHNTPRGEINSNATTMIQASAVPARLRSPSSDVSTSFLSEQQTPAKTLHRRPLSRKPSHPDMYSDQNDTLSPLSTTSSTIRRESSVNGPSEARRRTSHMSQSPPSSDLPSRAIEFTSTVDALSPGQRKMMGAFPGRHGVLLEGWLRQKQRRGVMGMKKWNTRYFVLYAKTNEVRYYTDVVQSAWGPIPLGELGSISLRLIQRIGKPSHPKYKGCRFDITCRNTWGTHYADDYLSSEEENSTVNGQEDNARHTPKSSRVYSLMGDSPQTTVMWVQALDSLLVRSANSPRIDMTAQQVSKLKKAASTAKAAVKERRRSSGLDMEQMVFVGTSDAVPKPVVYAMNFIFDSSPGIETELFYQLDADTNQLRNALKCLNQWTTDGYKPSKEELERVLINPVIAGAIIKLWLSQMEIPVIPFELYPDFSRLAGEFKTSRFDIQPRLRSMIQILPSPSFTRLACVLFHLNDVHVYASKNGMDAATLARLFSPFILRSRTSGTDLPVIDLVEEMISHVDTIIDEKEAAQHLIK